MIDWIEPCPCSFLAGNVLHSNSRELDHTCRSFLPFFVEYSGHAASVAKEYDLSCVTGIVLCSGDGLLYEVRSFVWSDVESTKPVHIPKQKRPWLVIKLFPVLRLYPISDTTSRFIISE